MIPRFRLADRKEPAECPRETPHIMMSLELNGPSASTSKSHSSALDREPLLFWVPIYGLDDPAALTVATSFDNAAVVSVKRTAL